MFGTKNGVSYYFIKGQREDKNLVFVHGVGGNWKFLKPLAEQMPEYNCYLIDLPGHGNSKEIPYSDFEDFKNAVGLFVSGLEDVVLIGHSLGGAVCLAVACMNIESVKSLVMLNSGAKFHKLDKTFMDKVHRGIVDKGYLLKTCGSYHKPLIYKQLTTFEKNPIMIKDLLIGEKVDLEHRLEEVKIPTLVVAGGDEILILVEYSETVHAGIAGSELVVVPKTRHMLPIAEKELISKLIKNFI